MNLVRRDRDELAGSCRGDAEWVEIRKGEICCQCDVYEGRADLSWIQTVLCEVW